MALRDRAPESDFRGYFFDTEIKLDEGNTAISRLFERSALVRVRDGLSHSEQWLESTAPEYFR
jgi:hypothetical protein